MQYQLVVDFDAESPIYAQLLATQVIEFIRKNGADVGHIELLDRCPPITAPRDDVVFLPCEDAEPVKP